MLQKWIVILFVLVSVSSISYAVEKAERISDREIIESLATLKEGQKAMNQRFDDMGNSINQRFGDMGNSINQRFDDVGKRFDQMFTFLWILSGIFTAITVTTISFAIWDRRSMFKPVEVKIKELEEGKVTQLINSLKDLAKVDKNVADALRRYNLF
ncbi:MAG: hypothetical protein ABII25_09820 [bacterium]